MAEQLFLVAVSLPRLVGWVKVTLPARAGTQFCEAQPLGWGVLATTATWLHYLLAAYSWEMTSLPKPQFPYMENANNLCPYFLG